MAGLSIVLSRLVLEIKTKVAVFFQIKPRKSVVGLEVFKYPDNHF